MKRLELALGLVFLVALGCGGKSSSATAPSNLTPPDPGASAPAPAPETPATPATCADAKSCIDCIAADDTADQTSCHWDTDHKQCSDDCSTGTNCIVVGAPGVARDDATQICTNARQ